MISLLLLVDVCLSNRFANIPQFTLTLVLVGATEINSKDNLSLDGCTLFISQLVINYWCQVGLCGMRKRSDQVWIVLQFTLGNAQHSETNQEVVVYTWQCTILIEEQKRTTSCVSFIHFLTPGTLCFLRTYTLTSCPNEYIFQKKEQSAMSKTILAAMRTCPGLLRGEADVTTK